MSKQNEVTAAQLPIQTLHPFESHPDGMRSVLKGIIIDAQEYTLSKASACSQIGCCWEVR